MDTPNGQPTPTAARRQFGDHALNVAVAAACFRAVRRVRPVQQVEAATVYIDHEAVAAWLGSSRVTVGGRWEEEGR